MPTARSTDPTNPSPTPTEMARVLYDTPDVPALVRPMLWRLANVPRTPVSRRALDVLELLWVSHVLPVQQQQQQIAARINQRLDSLVAGVAAAVTAEEADRLRRAADEADPLLPCSCGGFASDCDSDAAHRLHMDVPRFRPIGEVATHCIVGVEPPEAPPQARVARIVPSFRTVALPVPIIQPKARH